MPKARSKIQADAKGKRFVSAGETDYRFCNDEWNIALQPVVQTLFLLCCFVNVLRDIHPYLTVPEVDWK